jgi:7-keto-8-aminopelargonate synthetase-like enzyme
LRKTLWQRIDQFCATRKKSDDVSVAPSPRGAIIPVMIGDEAKAMEVAQKLRKMGIFVPAVRFPTVGRGQARLRITLSAAHTADQVEQLVQALDTSV